MAGEEKPDSQLFHLLSHLLQEDESLTNQEEVELRAKIEVLGVEVSKVPAGIAEELDKLSAKLDDVDEMISSTMASDPQVQTLLSNTAAAGQEWRSITAPWHQDRTHNPNN